MSRDPAWYDDPLWYKDALIYELHVKSFFDANDDGIGDFAGLTQKLDYIQDLGVSAIWLLPFYPSPLRDDGYDIADYKQVNASYGDMADFRLLVREAHRRNLRVITELVVNHTSDQHPWFQRARNAGRNSRYRDWYVWSETDQHYAETRVIFTDSETSNWSWDPVAKAYYWHRFFSHQPDLNFDNPQVVRAVINVMRFWLDAGVDGLRLDAIPYLVERAGTNNENLPETHTVLKQLRAELDANYQSRLFLGEANQWPEDVQRYFGDGDECHMLYHFPLMPRMYMAIAQEDRHPITDIMRQTPDIPENCQWAIFLRNHDELTLEMVTDSERDYLWNTYAADKNARLNLGIRRRLAPLLDNDRRRIELMNSLLLSMPGTPILYYGDEIGMGDNFFLGDRNGVRTPMQWQPDRNGGFSRADPARLFLPPLMDAIYGYQSVNVEAQSRNTFSLLNWTRRLIAVRQGHKVFGRGTLTFLYPSNRRIIAYLRQHEDETVLCVANLSRTAQAAALDLSGFVGRVPVELLGRSLFPVVSEAPYVLTLQNHSFFWFLLEDPAKLPNWTPPAEPPPEYVTLVFEPGWESLESGRERRILEQDVLPTYLPRQRWYGAKNRKLTAVTARSLGRIATPGNEYMLAMATAIFDDDKLDDQGTQRYLLPLAVDWRDVRLQQPAIQAAALAKIRRRSREGILYDAMADDGFILALVDRIRRGEDLTTAEGTLRFRPTKIFAALPPLETPIVRHPGVEQSNSSAMIEDSLIIKAYRRLQAGVHPEIEIGRYLTEEAGFANAPALFGSIELVGTDGVPTALAVMHKLERNQGDGWSFTAGYLGRYLDNFLLLATPGPDDVAPEIHAVYLTHCRRLGQRTGEMHQALGRPSANPDFQPEPLTARDVTRWQQRLRTDARRCFDRLKRQQKTLAREAQEPAARLLAQRRVILDRLIRAPATPLVGWKTRYHGDYHLGQVLLAENDFFIIDFEGEPRRSLAERRRRHSPLRDVAGMIRSFDYAAWSALQLVLGNHAERRTELIAAMVVWRDLAVAAFLAGYNEATGAADLTADAAATNDFLLRFFIVEKLFYEISYELSNRPAWVAVPLAGAVRLLIGSSEGDAT